MDITTYYLIYTLVLINVIGLADYSRAIFFVLFLILLENIFIFKLYFFMVLTTIITFNINMLLFREVTQIFGYLLPLTLKRGKPIMPE